VGPTILWGRAADGGATPCYTSYVTKEDQFKEIGKNLHTSRRHLPHFQAGNRTLFVTWRCLPGPPLSVNERASVMRCIAHFHEIRYQISAAVVMPDHVHILLYPLEKQPGEWWNLGELLKGIKGVAARQVNQSRGASGSLWQNERYDRLIRSDRDFNEKRSYIQMNPVREGLVEKSENWDALWLPDGSRLLWD
jgi:putative transposase